MYYINKIVGWLISPLGLMFLGTLAGMLMRLAGARAAKRNPECARAAVLAKAGAWLIGLSLAFLWVMSMGVTIRFIGVPLERPWERSGTMHGSIEGLPDADAVVILGGGAGSHKECHASELFSGADRVFCGAREVAAERHHAEHIQLIGFGIAVQHMGIAAERNGAVLIAADVDDEMPLTGSESAEVELHAGDIDIGIGIIRCAQRNAALCEGFREIGSAEIGIDEVEIDDRDLFAGCCEGEGEGGRKIGLAGAEMSGDHDNFLRLIHMIAPFLCYAHIIPHSALKFKAGPGAVMLKLRSRSRLQSTKYAPLLAASAP